MMTRIALLLTTAMTLAASPAYADEAALKTEIQMLKAQLAAQAARLDKLEGRSDVLAKSQEKTSATLAALPPAAAPAAPTSGAAPAATEVAATGGNATTIGGYGEFTYNGYLNDRSRNQADLARFVLFFGHRFSDKLTFNSELEIEHAVSSADDQGEVEIEQAYLAYQFNPALNLKGGLFLIPAGFINRNHEPPSYYGVMRNEVERRIIPSTWREGGVSLFGVTSFGLNYDVGVTTGFDVSKFDDPGHPLLSTHQELQLARAANASAYASVDYKGIPGVTLGGSVFSGNTTQANAAFRHDPPQPDLDGISARMTLWEAHARWQRAGFDLQALYARGSFAQADRVATAVLAFNEASGEDRPVIPRAFYGWYLQGAYTFALPKEMTLSPFARYERYDTQAEMPLELERDPDNRDKLLTLGFSFKPLPEVVVKADYQKFFDHSDNDRINLGLGYSF